MFTQYWYQVICKVCKNSRNSFTTPEEEFMQKRATLSGKHVIGVSDSKEEIKACHS